MAFIVRPLKFSHTDLALAVEPSVRITRSYHSATAEMISEVENGRSFLLGGLRGGGKTSLLNEVSHHFNMEMDNVAALGPLSLRLVAQNGLSSLGSQLRDWLRDNETRLPDGLRPSHRSERCVLSVSV
jgi:hypothetical protein